jgi:two-component system, LytTR family, sensor kinase
LKNLSTKQQVSNFFALSLVAGWILFSFLQFKTLGNFGLDTITALIDTSISNLCLAGAAFIIVNNMRYYLPGKEKYWYVIVLSLGLSAVWLVVVRGIIWLFLHDNAAYMLMLTQSLYIRYALAFLLLGCVTMISLLWYTQQNETAAQERKQELEQLAKDAELFKLRQQLQPHFLFNSLNSISALAGSQPEKARHMIQQLSDFLRGTLKKEDQEWVPLKEEIGYLQLYLDIEKVRFGHRLETAINMSNLAGEALIPPMILQPLVENAIKFGLYDTIEAVSISISASMQDQDLVILVSNPFDENSQPISKGTGFGLSYIQRRLYLLFGRTGLLNSSSQDQVFTAQLIIPQLHSTELTKLS